MKKCRQCKKDIGDRPSHIAKKTWKNRDFCSPECRDISRRTNKTNTDICLNCQQKLQKKSHERNIDWVHRQFCNKKCSMQYRMHQKYGNPRREGEKRCMGCMEFLPSDLLNFNSNSTVFDKLSDKCKKCKYKEHIKRVYSISYQEIEKRYMTQKGLCGICLLPLPSFPHRNIHIDHSRNTGKVRGLLHSGCNTGLGHVENELFRNQALIYLKLWAYEKEDFTTASTELACVSGACSIEEYQAMQAHLQEEETSSLSMS